MKRISCIVPTYNRGDVICETIRQLLDQDHPPHEIIVIDQTRHYPPAVEQGLAGFAREGKIIWLGQMAPNASMARNTGAVVATGEILVFLDDDIRIGRVFLAAHAANYEDADCDGVAGQVLEGEGQTVGERQCTHPDPEWDSLRFPKNFSRRSKTPWMISSNFSIKRSVYLELGGMDEWYEKGANREESDFALRYFRSGRMFQFDPLASLYHLGQAIVPGGGCRSYNNILGGWHHFVGMWYFTLGFAKPSTFLLMTWTHFRALALNRKSLETPGIFLVKCGMFVSGFFAAAARRIQGPRLLNCGAGGVDRR